MLRKFRVKINEKEYLVEMEELTDGNEQKTSPVPPPVKENPPVEQAKQAPQPESASGPGEPVEAPMPGTILAIDVKVGDTVVENQRVAVLEAMKMENEIVAPRVGVITAIPAAVGKPIEVGHPIVIIQ